MAETQKLNPEQELEQLRAENARLKASYEEQEQLIQEQNEQLELAEAQKGKALPVIIIDKKKHQVMAAKFQFGGKEYTAEELKEDKDLAKKLKESKSGLLQEIQ